MPSTRFYFPFLSCFLYGSNPPLSGAFNVIGAVFPSVQGLAPPCPCLLSSRVSIRPLSLIICPRLPRENRCVKSRDNPSTHLAKSLPDVLRDAGSLGLPSLVSFILFARRIYDISCIRRPTIARLRAPGRRSFPDDVRCHGAPGGVQSLALRVQSATCSDHSSPVTEACRSQVLSSREQARIMACCFAERSRRRHDLLARYNACREEPQVAVDHVLYLRVLPAVFRDVANQRSGGSCGKRGSSLFIFP